MSNKESRRLYYQEYRRRNPEKIKAIVRKYYEKNKSKPEYKRKMKRLKVEMSKHEGEMFRKIRNDGYDGLTITSSSDIFTLIKNDAKYVKIKKLLDEFEIAVDFLERTINNFKDRSWKLRDLVEIEKLEHL